MNKLSFPKKIKYCCSVFIFIVVGFLFFTPIKTLAITYYVNTATGNDDTGNGSQETPWKTLIKAETAATTGDTVNVTSGVYVEPSSIGGSTGNITFTKGITWVGQGGLVTVRGASSSSYFEVAGNTNTTSFSNFIFDSQNGSANPGFYINTGHANKSFSNCTFTNASSASYSLRINDGGTVTLSSSTIEHLGTTGGSALAIYNAGLSMSDSLINFTGGAGITSLSNSSLGLNLTDTDITATNPNGNVFQQASTRTTAISITGGSISVTGGTYIFSWGGGNVSLDGVTNNSSGTSSFIYAQGSSVISINNSNVTHSISNASYNGILTLGTSLTIQTSTLNFTGGLSFISNNSATNNPIISLASNTIDYSTSVASSYFIYDVKTGTSSITNNVITIPSGSIVNVFHKNPSTRSDIGAFTFNNNTVRVDIDFSKIIAIAKSNGSITISNNTFNSTLDTANGYIISLTDTPSPTITGNTITSATTDSMTSISILPSDVSNWLTTGVATISNNTIYSKSHSGYNIQLGQDTSSGSSYDQKWNNSTIANNTIYGPLYYGDTNTYTTHNILVGHIKGVAVKNNKIIGGSLAMVIKGLALDWAYEGGVYGNIIISPSYGGILSKGAVNLKIYNNSIYSTSSNDYTQVISIGENLVDFPTTGNKVYNNILCNSSLKNIYLIRVDQYSTSSFEAYNNIYCTENNDLSNSYFSFNGNSYTTFNSWNNIIGGGDNSLTYNPRFFNPSSYNLSILPLSSAIDVGTNSGLTTDYAGNSIYGLPDAGAYEYQPPFTFSSDNIPTTGSIRLYSDGKYRMTAASSTVAVARFSVTPLDGYRSTTTQYMDITINTWDTTGNMNKQWTATSTAGSYLTQATSTTYVIGDLNPNTYYIFKLDNATSTAITGSNCTGSICLANDSGQLTFTYTGGYSTHIFALEKDIIAPLIFNGSLLDLNSAQVDHPTFSWGASSDDESGLAKYSLYIDSTLDTDNISTTTTSVIMAGKSYCGHHTWFIRATDNNGNYRDSATSAFDRICGGGGSSSGSGTSYNLNQPTVPVTTPSTTVIIDTPSLNVSIQSNPQDIATVLKITRNEKLEQEVIQNVTTRIPEATSFSQDQKQAFANFIVYGTQETKKLGLGEREGSVYSFHLAFNKLPQTEQDWDDVLKIALGRWPSQTSPNRENQVKTDFRKVYLRQPNDNNKQDQVAIDIMAYGLRPINRNLNSEKLAAKYFNNIYGRMPKSSADWDIVRAIAYSGAKR